MIRYGTVLVLVCLLNSRSRFNLSLSPDNYNARTIQLLNSFHATFGNLPTHFYLPMRLHSRNAQPHPREQYSLHTPASLHRLCPCKVENHPPLLDQAALRSKLKPTPLCTSPVTLNSVAGLARSEPADRYSFFLPILSREPHE